MNRPARPARVALAAGSLACMVAANLAAVAVSPAGTRSLLAGCAGVAVGCAAYAAVRGGKLIGVALAASVMPLLGVLTTGLAWLDGPLAVLLVASAELGTWSFEQRGAGHSALPKRRAARTAGLCGAGLVAALLCDAVSRAHPWTGSIAVFAAALGATAVIWVLARAVHHRRR